MEQLVIYHVSLQKIRIGKPYDGGYVVFDLSGDYDAIISGGIANDISFEQAVLKYHPVPCFAYDGTIDRLPENDPRIIFIRKNIGKEESETLSNLHGTLNPYSNVFMKIDIKGHEFRLFPTFSEEKMKKIKQLVVKIHTPGDIQLHPNYFKGLSDITHTYMFAMLEKINRTHTLVHLHPNNGCKTHWVDGIMLPNVFECTFIRNDFVGTKQPNTNIIPQFIDMPNVPSQPIILFDHYPFVSTLANNQ
jgi:hypothetical protein